MKRRALCAVCLAAAAPAAGAFAPSQHFQSSLQLGRAGVAPVRQERGRTTTLWSTSAPAVEACEKQPAVASWSSLDAAVEADDAEQVRAALDALKEAGQARLWDSVTVFYQRYTLTEMMVATGLRGDIADKLGLTGRRDIDRIAAIVGGLTLAAALSTTGATQFLPGPDIVRFTVAWVLAFLPYGFLTLGIAKPQLLQRSLVRVFALNPEYKERLVRHEAGHLLIGYLCGLPVASIQADAVTNAVAFYDTASTAAAAALLPPPRELSPAQAEGLAPLPPPPPRPDGAGIPEGELLRLAAVSLGGIVAECRRFGSSEGGYADLMQLSGLLRCGAEPLSQREQQDRVRFAAVMAHTWLGSHEEAFEALVDAVKRGAGVAECIRAIEGASESS